MGSHLESPRLSFFSKSYPSVRVHIAGLFIFSLIFDKVGGCVYDMEGKVTLFNGILTFVGYLMPKPFL